MTSARAMVTPLPGPGSATTCQRHTDLVKTMRLQGLCRQVATPVPDRVLDSTRALKPLRCVDDDRSDAASWRSSDKQRRRLLLSMPHCPA